MSMTNQPQPLVSPSNLPKTNRRAFLAGTTLGVLGGAALGWMGQHLPHSEGGSDQNPKSPGRPAAANQALGIPGPYPGKVIEVNHPGSVGTRKVKNYTERNREVIKGMIARGMKELIGCDDAVEAWRHFFSPGDRVGIKVVPVGQPDSISSFEVVLEVIEGLRSAGVKLGDILVFERYRREFLSAGYRDILPANVHWECSSVQYDETQLEIDGQIRGEERQDHVAGYDPGIFRELFYCSPAHDPKDERRYRSHLSAIVSKKIDKFISIPVLKDHRSAGVTMALKNLSHGLVNNVCRSHITWRHRGTGRGATSNQCLTFIPAIASLPQIRQKAVLQILDGLVGTWEGGPHMGNRTFATWEYKSLFFATDPVALDHIGWQIIDQKRVKEGWPVVAQMGLDARTGVGRVNNRPYPEQFHIRQPQHVSLAETLGMGIFDLDRINHRRIDLS